MFEVQKINKMKNNLLIILLVALIVIGWLLQDKCDKTNNDLPIIDNSLLKEKVEKLKLEISYLSVLNDSLTKSYADSKDIKDSIVYLTKTRYITIFDTITNDTIECLPKEFVDTLILTYENVIKECDKKLIVQDSIIFKKSEAINKQDTMILNHEINEQTLLKQVRKEKQKGWFKSAVSFVGGVLIGKAI